MPQLIEQRVTQCLDIAERHFQHVFDLPVISLALRGNKAGVAHIHEHKLRFNQKLYYANRKHFLKHAVAHEVAHLVAYQVYGQDIRPHGQEWQHIMQQLYQLPAQRCHSYAVPARWHTLYWYTCQCPAQSVHKFSPQRHRLSSTKHCYLCRRCEHKLVFTGKVTRELK